MSDNKRSGGSFTGKGYYIALILCAAAIGITGYLYQRNEKEAVSLRETHPLPAATAEPDYAPAAVTQPILPRLPEPTTAPVKPTQAPQPAALETASPIPGTEVAGYSMEALSYNETTRDWRTHNGIDLAADPGTQVRAAADGTVYTTYEDESLGTTVVIRHLGGYTTRYCSLDKELEVKAGDEVVLGQAIGTVGTTALIENSLGPHVHFSVSHQDRPMDPAEFLHLSS